MATTKKEALEEKIKSLTMEYAKKIFEKGDSGFDWEDMTGLPIEKELFEEYVNKRKPLLEELYECENPDLCFEDFEFFENRKFENIYERIILEFDKITTPYFFSDENNIEPNEEIEKYMREYLKIEDDSEEKNIKAKELEQQIDILTEEYIKKIVDEVGCTNFVDIMQTDEDYGWDDYGFEDFEIEALNSPQYKQAKEVYNEYIDKRCQLILQLVEVRNDNGYDCDDDQLEAEYEVDFVYKFGQYLKGDI